MKKKLQINAFNIFVTVFIVLYSLSILLLMFWALLTSLKSVDEFRLNVLGLPHPFTFENYDIVFRNFRVPINNPADGLMYEIPFEQQLFNSVYYVSVSSLLAAITPMLVAYLTCRFPGKLSTVIYNFVVVTMALPIVGAQSSEMQILRGLHLYDKFIGLFIMKASFLGMWYLVYYAVFKGIPKDYYEAAEIDGASHFTLMTRIAFPLASATFFLVALLNFISIWNDYQVPYLYMPTKVTLSYGIYYMSISGTEGLAYPPIHMAGTTLVVAPILALFVIFRKKILFTVNIGGVKG